MGRMSRKGKGSLPILCYRNISPVCGVSPEEFRAHLGWMRENGWGTVGLDEAVGILKEGGEVPEKSVVITFDDCYLDNWVHAAPILRQTGLKAAFGVATAYLHDGPCRPDASTEGADLRGLPVAREAWERALERDDPSGFMGRLELGILVQEEGHVLFAHTHTHQACFVSDRPVGAFQKGEIHPGVLGIYPELREGVPLYPVGSAYAHDGLWPAGNDVLGGKLVARTTAERIEFCLGEFTECRTRLEAITGRAPRALAWPWGEWDGVAVETAQLAGFEAGLTMEGGANVPGETPMFGLRRVVLRGGTGPKEFGRRLKRAASPFWARFGRN